MAYADTYRYAYPDQQIDPITGLPIDNQYPPYMQPPVAQAVSRPRGAVEGITQQSDPRQAAQQDRAFAYNRGSEIDTSFLDDQNRAAFERDAFQNKLRGVYDPMIEGQGGLSQQQLANTTREGDLNSLQMTPDEIANSYLSPEERQAIQGNTQDRAKYFNPNYEGQLFDSGAARERGAVGDYATSLNEAFDPATLRPDAGFQPGLNQGVDQYGRTINETLDPTKLNVSDKFLNDYQLTPAQQQDIVTSAAATVGTRDKAAIGEMERRARAAGTNPLGVAAMRERISRESNANAADAATSARIAASSEAAKRLQTGEAMRLQAGTNYAGMKTDAAGRVLDAGYRAAVTGEDARSAAERDIASRRTQAATLGGQANIAREADLSQRQLGLQQNITQVGNAAQRDIETADQARAAALASNRQANDQYVQGQRYTRGLAANDRLADRYRYATDANRADAAEGRGYYATQGTQANSNYNQAGTQRAGIYGTQAGAGQAATRTGAQLDEADKNRPKWYDKLIGAASGAAKAYFGGGYAKGGVATKPTMALIGEDGPEMVLPVPPNQLLPDQQAQMLLRQQGLIGTAQVGLPPQITSEDFGRTSRYGDGTEVQRAGADGLADSQGRLTGSVLAQMSQQARENFARRRPVLQPPRRGGGYAQGGLVTEPTYALIGENGPEMVVPFNGDNPQVPPSALLQPGQAPPFATAPPPPRGRSPYSQQYRYAS